MGHFFPIFLNLKGKDCLVVGGGKVAFRKVKLIYNCGAKIRIVSPELTNELKKMFYQNKISWVNKKFDKSFLGNPFIVISATNNEEVNKMIASICKEKNIPVNVVDDPPKCSFHVPATVRRGDLTIAISTGGKSPAFAAHLRKQLESQFGNEYERYLNLLGELRKRVITEIPDEERRREIFKRLVESDLLELIKEGRESLIKERIEECIYF